MSEPAVTEVLILAGGLGTRLREAVPEVPKPLAPAGGRPFLAWLMDYWLGRGAKRFVLSVGHRAGLIRGHFGDEYRGAAVDYVLEDEPLGTGGAVARALATVEWRGTRLLLLNGDTWLTADPAGLARAADRLETPVTLTLAEVPDNQRYGAVETDENGRVTRFGPPAPGRAAWINAGCALLDITEAKRLLRGFPPRFSLEADFLPGLAERGLLGADRQTAAFIDIGIPEDYRRFCEAGKGR